MEVTESEKLQWQSYVPAVSREPLNVFYMRQAADSYGASGFSFNVKTPAINALLDPEAYIRYKVRIREFGTNFAHIVANCCSPNNTIYQNWGNSTTSTTFAGPFPKQHFRLAFRQGNVMQRCMQSIVLTVNGYSLDTQPWKFVDPLNRIYVSEQASKHIFSGSGGKFDNGNHSYLVQQDNFFQSGVLTKANTWDKADVSSTAATYVFRTHDYVGVNKQADTDGTDIKTATNVVAINQLSSFPDSDYFFNEGFTDRYNQFIRLVRGSRRELADLTTGRGLPNTLDSDLTPYTGEQIGTTGFYWYEFEIIEPIPIPPFKMYQNDYVMGVIPHIRDMIIRCNFAPDMISQIFQGNWNTTSTDGGIQMYWSGINAQDCELLCKWYSPPASLVIPREITIPLRKIDVNSFTLGSLASLLPNEYEKKLISIAQHNISLEAVPDLLLIYVRQRYDDLTMLMPCDFHMEMRNLTINMENNGGKLTQISSYQMWKNWIKYIKHTDVNKETYDEWRKYLWIAMLRPEDYGIIRGPGYDNSIVLGITADIYNWHVAPVMGWMYNPVVQNPSSLELIITAIYDRWSLTLTDNGHARAGLTRIRDSSTAGLANTAILASQNPSGVVSVMQ